MLQVMSYKLPWFGSQESVRHGVMTVQLSCVTHFCCAGLSIWGLSVHTAEPSLMANFLNVGPNPCMKSWVNNNVLCKPLILSLPYEVPQGTRCFSN